MTASYDTRFKDGTCFVVRAVTLSGFPASCDGDTVVLQPWGNDEGDPSVPRSDDALLATADSALSACGQTPLSSPLTVSSGAIELHLCRSGGAAGEVLVHDLTLLTLTVDGEPVPIGAGDDPDPSAQPVSVGLGAAASPPPVSAAEGRTGALAFTGAAVWALIGCALAAVSGGFFLLVLGWLGRGRRSKAGSA